MKEMISKDAVLKILNHNWGKPKGYTQSMEEISKLPIVQPETCEGCKHLGKWENEVEYGYPSPCTRCKRRAEDHYER